MVKFKNKILFKEFKLHLVQKFELFPKKQASFYVILKKNKNVILNLLKKKSELISQSEWHGRHNLEILSGNSPG